MSMWISVICMLMGSIFILIAAIGLLRMPDLLMRMHAATKAGTLGAGLVLISVIFHFQRWSVTIESILTIFFIFITAPIASHLLARASYLRGLKLAKSTIIDELKDKLL
ncbi:monovalent cation/H(+) antiporter subunit G [Legionella jamestowniensis]|uniref:Na(+)/H(+) antiporter subunit G n=1 Tax=Legionella jamestowniensis TaxID=455 RepID=A0A0W0UZF3_9GAMM|nr:monovalent cation/H(+) antiporter subunit G [Legionella jamestowniensis]KTD13231.1 Na(+)/H(+) antiporter subunit G [Legionella jamestowniensis]OCH98267.1 Na+/H+ antiporter subunit G [Legionella jamestowniensis]SFL78372.1 multisubunit sodium/proton antiporter, MrpG subunit [Legionella jamestowniensis DSM 19215]